LNITVILLVEAFSRLLKTTFGNTSALKIYYINSPPAPSPSFKLELIRLSYI